MRAFTIVLLTALLALWVYFGVSIENRPAGWPARLGTNGEEISSAAFNNTALDLAHRGQHHDALAYLERAHELSPGDEQITAHYVRYGNWVKRHDWEDALGGLTGAGVLLLLLGWGRRLVCAVLDRFRLAGLRLRGDNWFWIDPKDDEAELLLRFNKPVDRLVRRHPLTLVWSSSGRGKHMKSPPPVAADGRRCTVKLNRQRLEKLRRCRGDWRGFLYLGKTQVGEAGARVG